MGAFLAKYVPFLFTVDAFLVAAHLVFGRNRFWNLDKEHNFPTWFSGLQLVLLALAAADCFEGERPVARRLFPPTSAWAVLSASFLYLSLDETTVIHEGVFRNELRDLLPLGSLWISLLPWQLVFGPVLALLAALMLGLFVTRFSGDRSLAAPAFGGIGCWGLAVLAEGLAKPVFMSIGWYRQEVALEEGLELAGATLLLLGLARYARDLPDAAESAVDVRGQLRRSLVAGAALAGFIAIGATVVAAVSLRNSAWLYRHNAGQLAKRGKHAEALVAWQQALARDPESAAAFIGLAHATYRLRRYEESVQWYDRALEQKAGDAALWHDRGTALYKLGRLEDAERSYRRSVEANPRYARSWADLGLVLEKQNRSAEAIEAFGHALRADPNHDRARRGLERLQAGNPAATPTP